MIKEKYNKLPIFWKITIASAIVFAVFILFIAIAQTAVFFDWFIDHRSKYGIELNIFDDIFESYGYLILITAVLGLFISVIGAMAISRLFLKNIRELTNTMEQIKNEGRLDKRVNIIGDGRDEISKLGIVFNSLMDDLEASFNRERRFVQDASHELKTPLTIIKGHLSLLNRWGKNDKEVLDKSIKASSEEVDRLIDLVKTLLDISKLDNLNERLSGSCNTEEVLKNILDDFSIIKSDYNIKVNYNGIKTFPMSELHMKQLIIILLDNAIKYSTTNKNIDIIFEKNNNNKILKVVDRGIGIPKEDIPFLFDRFYRVDESRNSKTGGNGLGLSIAKKLVNIYGGTIFVNSKLGEGSIFEIKI